ncbi:MAG TPA: DUF835 domain-containing protein [Thermoplasmata archaeon]
MTARGAPEVPDGGQTLRVSTIPGAMGTIDPRRLQEIKVAASAFIDEHGPGTVVLDCVDALTLHVGVERVLRVIDDLHEEVAMRNAVLVVFVDPQRTNPRTVAWLARELDPIPQGALEPGVEDRLVA